MKGKVRFFVIDTHITHIHSEVEKFELKGNKEARWKGDEEEVGKGPLMKY